MPLPLLHNFNPECAQLCVFLNEYTRELMSKNAHTFDNYLVSNCENDGQQPAEEQDISEQIRHPTNK